jgi:hypothetical protein
MHNHGTPEDVQEQKTKTLQIEVWLGKDGKVETVNESGHLGTKELTLHEPVSVPPIYECTGAYGRPASKIPVTFTLESLGTIGTRPTLGQGVHPVTTDAKFNALAWLDEPEKVAALSDAEKVKLQNIGVVELNDIVLAALVAVPRVWTPMVDAAQAIMQHANGTQEDFPEPIVTQAPDIIDVPDHADGAKATLKVGEHEFTVGGKYFRFVGYGICKGLERYAFTWMDVPVSYLDEPK